jgi:hypothetical protein
MKSLIFVLILLISFQASAYNCNEWFKREKLSPGPRCFDSCELRGLGTDEDDQECSIYCAKLCKSVPLQEESASRSTKSWSSPFTYYPGLTEIEKKLVKENPKEAFIVFLQKNTAEEETQKYFPKSLRNDEGDAFRHFVWAGLLTKELGVERARVYLDAHESYDANPENEKAMDLANNRAGILEAEKLIKDDKMNLENLERSAVRELGKKHLIVLEPQGQIPEGIK